MDEEENFMDKVSKILLKFTSKFDGVSQWLKDKYGININVGMIVAVIVGLLAVGLIVKLALGIIMGKLYSGNY